MITGFIISALYILFYNLISLFPAGTGIPSYIINGISNMSAMMYSWNNILPISELVTTISLIVPIILAVFTIRVIMYIIALVRGNSMPGTSSSGPATYY